MSKTESDIGDMAIPPEIESVFREYARLIYRTAYGITGSREDAEDVLQTLFLRLLRRALPSDLCRNPKAYFYKAAVNMSLDTLRSHRRHPTASDAEAVEAFASPQEMDDVLHRRLYKAISLLKADAAEILILRYVHDYSDAEIARMLGVSRGSIALKLFRSRARLKKLLRPGLGDKS